MSLKVIIIVAKFWVILVEQTDTIYFFKKTILNNPTLRFIEKRISPMVSMYCSLFECSNCMLHAPRFIQSVSVDINLSFGIETKKKAQLTKERCNSSWISSS